MFSGQNNGDIQNADLQHAEEPASRKGLRIGVAALILAAAVAAACIVMVPADQAEVITRFGSPIRVITEPGLAWKWPAPIESAIPIDLRLLTTATGLEDVGTRDGLRVLVQAYVAWQVPSDPQEIRQFLRSVRNQPNEAARQLRSYVNANLHVISSNFALEDLVNVDPQKVRLNAFEDQLRAQTAPRMLQVYGIAIRQIGIERMTLPEGTLAATVARMKAERETVAAQRTAEGLQKAFAIRADAEKEAREVVAEASEKAARTEADAQQAAARTYQRAYQSDPNLYETLRSLDTINQLVSHTTNLILNADSPAFKILVDGPPGVKNAGTNAASAADPTSPAANSSDATKASAPAKVPASQKAPVPRKDGAIPEVAGR
jgi:modulator of FtsH protease HflC